MASWGFQEKNQEEGITPRHLVSLHRGPNQKTSTITLAPSLFTRTDPIEYKLLRITGDVEACSRSILCRYLMESFGTWAYPSDADPRLVCYFNGNRVISDNKTILKSLGLHVEAAPGEATEDFARHALLASIVNHLLGPGGMERIQIEHESDLCFARDRSDGSEFVDVVAIDNLTPNDARDKAHINVSAFVYRRQVWKEPTNEEEQRSAVLGPPGFTGPVVLKRRLYIPESAGDKIGSHLFSPADLGSRARGLMLYLPDTMQRLCHYWLLRAGVRLRHPRHVAQVTERPALDDEGRVAERTEMLPAELFFSALVHYPSKTRTTGPELLDRLMVLLSQAPFVADVEVQPEPLQGGSQHGEKLLFVSAASLLRAKKAKGFAPDTKSGGMALAGGGREYAPSALKNDFNDSASDAFSDSGDEL